MPIGVLLQGAVMLGCRSGRLTAMRSRTIAPKGGVYALGVLLQVYPVSVGAVS